MIISMTLYMVGIVVGCNCMRKTGAKIKGTVREEKERRQVKLRAHKNWERKRVIQLNSLELNIEHKPKYFSYGTIHNNRKVKYANEKGQKMNIANANEWMI